MRERRLKFGLAWALAGMFFLLIPAPLTAGAITEQIRATVEKAQTILQDPRWGGKEKERRAQLRQVIGRRFDFTEMAKRSLGSHWQGRSPRERAEFLKLFTDLAEETYLDQIDPYLGQKIVYVRESRDADFSESPQKSFPRRETSSPSTTSCVRIKAIGRSTIWSWRTSVRMWLMPLGGRRVDLR